MINRLTFWGVFAELNGYGSKIMIVDISWAVAIKELEHDTVCLQVIIAWHFISVYRALRAHHRVVSVQLHSVTLFFVDVVIGLRLKRLINEGITDIIMQDSWICAVFLINFLDQIVLILFLILSLDVSIDSLNTGLVCLHGSESVVVPNFFRHLIHHLLLLVEILIGDSFCLHGTLEKQFFNYIFD